MTASQYRISDFTGHYVLMRAWDAEAFTAATSLQPLDPSAARSRISWWVQTHSEHAALIRRVVMGSGSGAFTDGADHAIEDAFRLGWKLFKLPTVERRAIALSSEETEAEVEAEEPTEKDWIEIVLKDAHGAAAKNVRYKLRTPDGAWREGTTDGAGKIRVDDIDQGFCQITFAEPAPAS